MRVRYCATLQWPPPPFLSLHVSSSSCYSRAALCTMRVSSKRQPYTRLSFLPGIRISNLTNHAIFKKISPSCFIYFFVYYGGRVVESFFLKNNSFFSSRFLHPTMKLQSKYTFSIDTLYLPIDKIVKCLSGLKFNRFNLLYCYFIHRLTFVRSIFHKWNNFFFLVSLSYHVSIDPLQEITN